MICHLATYTPSLLQLYRQHHSSEMSSQGWEVRFSNSHQQPYFFNGQTGKSVWETPAGLSEDQVYALPGARQYLPASGAGARTAGVPAAKGGRAGEVRASHILAKHRGSRRPSSWRQVSAALHCPLSDDTVTSRRRRHAFCLLGLFEIRIAYALSGGAVTEQS